MEARDFAVARIPEGHESGQVSCFEFIARGRETWGAGCAPALSWHCLTVTLAHWLVADIRYAVIASHSTKAVVAEWQTHQT